MTRSIQATARYLGDLAPAHQPLLVKWPEAHSARRARLPSEDEPSGAEYLADSYLLRALLLLASATCKLRLYSRTIGLDK